MLIVGWLSCSSFSSKVNLHLCLGLIGVWGEIIRIWLNELLPDNAAELCR